MAIQVASLFATIGADLSGLNTGLSRAQGKLQSVAGQMSSIGKTMTAAVTVPIVGAGVAVVSMAGNFEQQMALLNIALRGTGAEMDTVRGFALQMGADTVYNAQEMADAMMGLAKAGQNWEQIAGDMTGQTGTLAAVTSLAAASDLGLAQAADTVAIAMATFGLSADDAVGIVDNFVQAADASVAEVGGLAAALSNVGPTAAQFGWTLGDVNTALALLSERGIQGGEAGTALKSMMTNMMRQTDDVTGSLELLNVALYDESGAMRDLPAIMSDLEAGLAGMSEEQRNAHVQTLAGTYGMKAMATLLAEGAEGWQAMEGNISDAATAQEVAAARMSGLKGTLEELSGSMESLGIKVGSVLIPWIKQLVDSCIAPFLDKILALNPELLKWGIIIAGVAAAAGPFLVVLGALIPVLGALFSPIGLVVAALGGLAAAFALNLGGIRDTAMEMWAQIQPIFQQLAVWVQEKLPQAFQSIKETLAPAIAEVSSFIMQLFGQVIEWLIANLPLIQETVQTIGEAISTFWEAHGQQILSATQLVWESIKTIISTTLDVILNLLTLVMQVFTGDWPAAMETLRLTWATVWLAAQSVFTNFVSTILALLGTSLSEFTEMWQTNLEMARQIVVLALNKIKSAIAGFSLRDVGAQLIDSLRAGIEAAAQGVISAAVAVVRRAVEAAKNAVGARSPSTVFIGIGKDMMAGLEQGLKAFASLPQQALTTEMGKIANIGNLAPQLTPAPAMAGGSNTTWTGNIIINGASNPQSSAAAVIRALEDRGMLSKTALR